MKVLLIVAGVLLMAAFCFISAEDSANMERLAGQDQYLSSLLK